MADFVLLPPGSLVAELRDAVLSKNVSILTGIAPSQLLVYKNKASLDKRNNATKDEGKEEPLDPTQFVDGLGSKEDMLVVVVPSPSQTSQQPQPSSFPTCKLPFFNSIHDITEIDGGSLVSFGKNMPSTQDKICHATLVGLTSHIVYGLLDLQVIQRCIHVRKDAYAYAPCCRPTNSANQFAQDTLSHT